MKKVIVFAVVLLMVPGSLPAQEEGLAQQTQSSDPKPKVTALDSVAPRFSRDNLLAWSKAWGGPRMSTNGAAAPSGVPSKTQRQGVRKRRKWPYLMSGGIVTLAGALMTAKYTHCDPNALPNWVTCPEWSSNWVLGGGIALIVGGGALLVHGATR